MPRIQVLDDDRWCAEAMIAFMDACIDHGSYEYRREPRADDGRDVYIVDNEFETGDHGVDLVRRIRERNPDAMIVLCTGTCERIDPQIAMNSGCNALIEKGSESGREELVALVRRYAATHAESSGRFTLVSAIRDIRSIISTWNTRMEQDAAIRAKTHR